MELSNITPQPSRSDFDQTVHVDRNAQTFKDEYFSDIYFDTNSDLTHDFYEYEQGQKDIIVKGRLKANIQFWKNINANSFVIDTIENGYKIPFFSKPSSCFMKNNRSALSEYDFVSGAIQDLLQKGLIEKCGSAPYVVNPLSVSIPSNGKKRLILDLRTVNRHMWKQTVKYEDLRIALSYLESGDWMIKFDIHSAYHFIDIYYPHTTYLGFSWPNDQGDTCYYTFLVLPFGIRSAPYLYSKVTRPLIAKWRGEGKRAIMYLDDGFACGKGNEYMQRVSSDIKNDLLLSGFVPKVDKSCWEPVQQLTWLGADLDSEQFSISIPSKRIEKLLDCMQRLQGSIINNKHVQVRSVASVVGQIISMGIVVGSVSQIMTRSLSIDILNARTWNSYIKLSSESMEQLLFWQRNITKINSRRLKEIHVTSKLVYSDASGTGYAGYEVHTINGVAHGMWSPEERCQSSTWRELVAVQRVLKSLKNSLANHRVKWFTDNKNVCSIVQKGSMRPFLQEIALDIFSFCSRHCISIEPEWLARKLNERADSLSRVVDKDDWGISHELFQSLQNRWGKTEVDWFASSHNAKLPHFYSRFWEEGSAGADAFTENWGKVFGFFNPPICLITRVLKQMEQQRASGIMVIPFWKSAPFWPLIHSNKEGFISNVVDWVDLPTSKRFYSACKNELGMFGNEDLKFRMLALCISFS